MARNDDFQDRALRCQRLDRSLLDSRDPPASGRNDLFTTERHRSLTDKPLKVPGDFMKALIVLSALVFSIQANVWREKENKQVNQRVVCVDAGSRAWENNDNISKAIQREFLGGKVKSILSTTTIPAAVIPAYADGRSSVGAQVISGAQICITFQY